MKVSYANIRQFILKKNNSVTCNNPIFIFLVANAFLLLSSLFLHIILDIIGQIVLFCVFILITEMNVKENVCVYIGCHSITTIFSVAHDMTL